MRKENQVIISLEIPKELKEQLRYAAFKNNVTLSEYIRQKLVLELQKEDEMRSRSQEFFVGVPYRSYNER